MESGTDNNPGSVKTKDQSSVSDETLGDRPIREQSLQDHDHDGNDGNGGGYSRLTFDQWLQPSSSPLAENLGPSDCGGGLSAHCNASPLPMQPICSGESANTAVKPGPRYGVERLRPLRDGWGPLSSWEYPNIGIKQRQVSQRCSSMGLCDDEDSDGSPWEGGPISHPLSLSKDKDTQRTTSWKPPSWESPVEVCPLQRSFKRMSLKDLWYSDETSPQSMEPSTSQSAQGHVPSEHRDSLVTMKGQMDHPKGEQEAMRTSETAMPTLWNYASAHLCVPPDSKESAHAQMERSHNQQGKTRDHEEDGENSS